MRILHVATVLLKHNEHLVENFDLPEALRMNNVFLTHIPRLPRLKTCCLNAQNISIFLRKRPFKRTTEQVGAF